MRTSIEHVRQEHVRRRNMYARKMRTSQEHVVTIYVRHQITYARQIRTPVEDVRQQNMYAQVSISEFVLTVVDLPECVPRISISMVVVGTRCRRSEDKRI